MGSIRVIDDTVPDIPVVSHHRLGTVESPKIEDSDPFSKSADDIKSLGGTTPVFKRRIANEMKKAYQNNDGSVQSKQVTLETVTGYNAFDVITPPYNMDYLARLYELSSPHYSAVNAKVSNIVGLGFNFVESPKTKRRLEDMDEGQTDKIKRARKGLQRAKEDLNEFIDNLNRDDTFMETLVKVWRDYEVTGNGYIEIGRKRDGTIGYIGHIPAISLRIRRDRDGFVQMISNKAVFFRNFGDNKTSNPFGNDNNPNEIIHIKKYSPTSTYYGVPDIIAAKAALAGNEFASRFNLDYFENKAVPRHVITLKGAKLATSTENALLSFFETGLKGQNHRSLYIPLPAGTKENPVEFKIDPVEAGIQDSSFNNYRKGNQSDILMAHRVPVTKVSVSDSASLAIARDADKTFKEQVCAPEQKILEKKLNKIIKEITDAFELKLNEMTLTDADTQSKIDERDVKNQIKVPNEIRADRGLPGRKGGDKPLDLKPQQAADARAQGTRARDSARSASATDSAGEARSPKGDGRTT